MVCPQVHKLESELRHRQRFCSDQIWLTCIRTATRIPCCQTRRLPGSSSAWLTGFRVWCRYTSIPHIYLVLTWYILEIRSVYTRLYEPSPVPTLYVGRIEDLLGRVPLFPCFLDGNTTSTIPHKYAPRQKQAFEYGCADGSGQGSRRGSNVYEINTWLWNFGRPQPRISGLSVAKTEGVRRQSRSETARRGAETKKARKRAVDQIWQTYTWYLPVIYTNSVNRAFRGFMTCLQHWHLYVHAGAKLWW